MFSYFQFIRSNAALLAFGFLCVFWGNFGQSFFVSWFGAGIQAELGISAATYGSAYSLATLVSAIVVVWGGALIDRIALSRYCLIVAIGLALACCVLAISSQLWMLCVGFFLLRFFGQALFPHTGVTTMARYFDQGRGKAVSIAGTGVPAGEVVLPLLAVALIAAIGWRYTLVGIALMTGLFFIPLSRYLLRRSALMSSMNVEKKKAAKTHTGLLILLRDRRYWLALPGLSAAPFVVTGVFIHQDFIVAQKSWSPMLLASSFVVYGLVHWVASIISGIGVDRFSAKRMLPSFLIYLTLSMLFLAFVSGTWVAPIFMALLGMTIGFAQPISAALWAEVYGTEILGSVRAVNVSAMVFASSLSPILFGVLIDKGVALGAISLGCAVFAFLANILMFFSYPRSA